MEHASPLSRIAFFSSALIGATIILCSSAAAQLDSTRETIFLATGEYNPVTPWDALLRFDDADTMHSFISGPYTPDATIPVSDCLIDTVQLNFAHGFYYNDATDELYVSTLFTNSGNVLTSADSIAVGAIAIFSGMSGTDTAQAPTRYIFGDSTKLAQPHGIWLDQSRDMLYVANTMSNSILVFHNASTISGNVPPDREISHANLGSPVHVYIDSVDDIIFAGVRGVGMGTTERIAIYPGASGLNGSIPPLVRIEGSATRLGHINPTVHNVWYDRNLKLLAVAHHVNELLFFDLDTVNLTPPSPVVLNLAPRVVQVDSLPGTSDDSLYNAYGFHWNTANDRMYVTIGYGHHMYDSMAPPNVIKVYDGLSDPAKTGLVPPTRVIHWTNANTYYPPQPIWVKSEPDSIYRITFGIPGGWHMLSVPLVPADSAKTTLYPSATSSAFAYSSGYVVRDTLQTGEGYWLKFGGPSIVNISGWEMTADTITLVPGWNIVGTLSHPAPTGLMSSSPGGLTISPFFTYLGGGYVAHDTLRPGRGYWVKSSGAGDLYTTVSGNVPSTRVHIVDNGELPPPPPDGDDPSGEPGIPLRTELHQNYPNPYNPETEIRYALAERSAVSLVVTDMLGREMRRVEISDAPAGDGAVRFVAAGLATGVYFYRMEARSLQTGATILRATRKMVVLR